MTISNKINIFGIIGIDTKYENIVQQLDKIKGDLEILINSAGGYVYDGIGIHNAIKKYDKGKKTIKVCGLSASIASYIMMAGDNLELEDNSVVMIHNPSMIVMGDHRKLKTACTQIEKLRTIMSSAYSNFTGLNKTDLEIMMDNETYFIGSEDLKTWGYVIENVDIDNTNKNNKINKLTKADAELQVQAMCSLISKNQEHDNLEKFVALLDNSMNTLLKDNSINKNSIETNIKQNNLKNTNLLNTNPINNKQSKTMEKIENLEDLKLNYPKLYKEAFNEGIKSEQSRVNAHLEFIDVAPETAIQSIKENVSFLNNSEIQAKYLKAKINKNELIAMQNDNNISFIPKQINTTEELKNESTKINLDEEEKIKAFMPHLRK